MALKSPKRVKKSAERTRKSGISRTVSKQKAQDPPTEEKIIEEFTSALKVFQKGDLATARSATGRGLTWRSATGASSPR
jgi:hypothetical protein